MYLYDQKLAKTLKSALRYGPFCVAKSKFFSISIVCLYVQAPRLIASQIVCKPHNNYDETTCLNHIKLGSKEFCMISSVASKLKKAY